MARQLVEACRGARSVVAYNASFERRCLKLLAAAVPELAEGLLDISARLADPLPVVRRHVDHPDFGGSFSLDLLFYHLKLRRYVVIELEARKVQPGDGAQLGMYMTAVDRLVCHPDDKPTVGLLLVREKNRVLVEYDLGDNSKPIGVATGGEVVMDGLQPLQQHRPIFLIEQGPTDFNDVVGRTVRN